MRCLTSMSNKCPGGNIHHHLYTVSDYLETGQDPHPNNIFILDGHDKMQLKLTNMLIMLY